VGIGADGSEKGRRNFLQREREERVRRFQRLANLNLPPPVDGCETC
jgi:hypothetical protein